MNHALTDWPAFAQIYGLELAGRELDRVTGALTALEEMYRPLFRDLSPDLEPAPSFRASPEGGE